ncbi:MAG: hypothetical protein QOI95_2597 [Acidimicrobiaceae bacterium]|jgi:hypothetical protein
MPARCADATEVLIDGDSLSLLRSQVCDAASRFGAQPLDRDMAVAAMQEWSTIAHAADAALAMAVARVDECGPPPSAGASDAADFVAKTTGTTSGKAKEKIKTGAGLRANPKTRAKAVAGELSTEQTAAITDAIAVNPNAEDKLLGIAASRSVGALRDECGKAKTEGQDVAAIEKRIHTKRHLRRYRDSGGVEHLHAAGTKATMARIDQALKPLIDELFKEARTDGVREPLEAYAYDALVLMCDRSGGSQPAKTARPTIRNLIVLRIDLEALIRGTTKSGESCEIVGLGPISVEAARAMLGESILKLVITKGIDVQNVTHLGRGPNMAQKIALLWQQPVCTRDICNRTARLEYNHEYGVEYRKTKHTRLDETGPLCDPDHDLQTYQDWALVDGTGKRPMVPPGDPRHPRHTNNRPPP